MFWLCIPCCMSSEEQQEWIGFGMSLARCVTTSSAGGSLKLDPFLIKYYFLRAESLSQVPLIFQLRFAPLRPQLELIGWLLCYYLSGSRPHTEGFQGSSYRGSPFCDGVCPKLRGLHIPGPAELRNAAWP